MKKLSLLGSLIFVAAYLFAQNIGIGTSTPTRARFEVVGVAGSGNTSALFGGDGQGISLQRNWPTIGFNQYRDDASSGFGKYIGNGYAGSQYLDPNSGAMFFDLFPFGSTGSSIPSSTRALTINNLGYMGLSNAIPNAQLQFPNVLNNRRLVLWEAANNDHQFFGLGIESAALTYNVGGSGDMHRFYCGNGANGSTTLMTIGGNKKVLIATQSGGGFLGINSSDATHTIHLRQANNTGLYIEEAGSGTNWEFRAGYTAQTDYAVLYVRCNGSDVGFFRPTGEYVPYSDQRLKDDIEPMSSTLAKVMQLQPKIFEYKMNNSNHEKSYGFIAQEVKPLFPDLVVINKSSDNKGLDQPNALSYAGIGVIAIKAIQEEQTEIDKLRKENEDLKKKLGDMEKKITALLQIH